jgi:hypothetical protein
MTGIREGWSCALGEELEYLTLQRLIRGEETLGVEYLPDRELLMLFCRNCERDCPFVFIPLITWVAKKLEENLPAYHVVGNNAWKSLFQDLASALIMSQGFSLAADGAIGRVLPAPLVEESPAGKWEANRLHESFLKFLREWRARQAQALTQKISAAVRASEKRFCDSRGAGGV